MLNPQAPEFKPTQLAVQAQQQNPTPKSRDPQRTRRQQRNRKGSKQQYNAWWWSQMQMAYQMQLAQSLYFAPNAPVAAQDEEEEFYDDQISPEHLREIMDTDAWVETMVQLEDEEREHLTAMALELAPAVGWHLDHDLELVPAEDKEGGLTVVAKPKPKGPSAKGGSKPQVSKQRRTNKGANKATTR